MSEYWIQGSDLEFADGDAGIEIRNHEMHVVAHYWQLLADHLQASDCEQANRIGGMMEELYTDDCLDCIMLRANILDEFPDNDPFEEYVEPNMQISADEYAIAFGTYKDDARLYACQNLGWIRVAGNHLETWGINRKKAKQAAWALAEIDEDETREWYMEDRKTGKTYQITIADLENFNLVPLATTER